MLWLPNEKLAAHHCVAAAAPPAGKLEAFAANARIVHIDIDPAEVGALSRLLPVCSITVPLALQASCSPCQLTTCAEARVAPPMPLLPAAHCALPLQPLFVPLPPSLPAQIHKNKDAHIPICSDVKPALQMLNRALAENPIDRSHVSRGVGLVHCRGAGGVLGLGGHRASSVAAPWTAAA